MMAIYMSLLMLDQSTRYILRYRRIPTTEPLTFV
jgi:hypothetical protein